MSANETDGTRTCNPKPARAAHKQFMTMTTNTSSQSPVSVGIDPLLSITEISQYLRAPVSSVYAWRAKGDGPRGLRIGRRVLYRLSEVDRWVESRADLH